ncbi:MAG TPA: hypothetical protein VM581_01895 [Magnetospirillaceae bacterium]|nr:hypothetical protein [Magnetospirillaceae bacterium]
MAQARVTIWYQVLPANVQAGSNAELRRLVASLIAHYRDNFLGLVAEASKIEDRVKALDVKAVASDELNYNPHGPRLWVELELPTTVAGRPEVVGVKHKAFLTRWLEHDAPDVGRGEVLNNEVGDAEIGMAMSFAMVHQTVATT